MRQAKTPGAPTPPDKTYPKGSAPFNTGRLAAATPTGSITAAPQAGPQTQGRTEPPQKHRQKPPLSRQTKAGHRGYVSCNLFGAERDLRPSPLPPSPICKKSESPFTGDSDFSFEFQDGRPRRKGGWERDRADSRRAILSGKSDFEGHTAVRGAGPRAGLRAVRAQGERIARFPRHLLETPVSGICPFCFSIGGICFARLRLVLWPRQL